MIYYQIIGKGMGDAQYVEAQGAEPLLHDDFHHLEFYIYRNCEWRVCSARCGRVIAKGFSRDKAVSNFAVALSLRSKEKILEAIEKCVKENGLAPGFPCS